jgi:CubicO group peptidase (beta-lactamase class C family)
MRKLFLVVLLIPLSAVADHEPFAYSFAAKKGNLPIRNVVTLESSKNPTIFIENIKSDSAISAKLDDILIGEPKAGLAALAVSKGKIVYEKYLNDGKDNLYPSWSMAKSLTSMTMGYALCEGKIESLNDKAEKYSDTLRGTPWGDAKIKDLLTMSSGASAKGLDKISGDYSYGASGVSYMITRSRMTINESFKKVGNDDGKKASGGETSYNNLDTDALALVVTGATKEPFHEYFNRKIWSQINSEFRGMWALDSNKQAIAHAYFFASVRDYSKIAVHLIDIYKGRTGDACLRNYIKDATTAKKLVVGNIWYGYQFWVYGARSDTFAMWGHQGQEIIINPENEKIIVLTSYNASVRKKTRDPNILLKWLRTDSSTITN